MFSSPIRSNNKSQNKLTSPKNNNLNYKSGAYHTEAHQISTFNSLSSTGQKLNKLKQEILYDFNNLSGEDETSFKDSLMENAEELIKDIFSTQPKRIQLKRRQRKML